MEGESAISAGPQEGIAASAAQLRLARAEDCRRGVMGRRWAIARKSQSWLFKHALSPAFLEAKSWRQTFRIPHGLLRRILSDMKDDLTLQTAKLRKPLRPELRQAAFLMRAGGCSHSAAASQLGIGCSAAGSIARDASRLICEKFKGSISLPQGESEIAKVMSGFQSIRKLPRSSGAIDGAHMRWLSCPSEQRYERRCCKSRPSIVAFILPGADRKMRHADIGSPGALGDSAIYEQSNLKEAIDAGSWIGPDMPSLVIGDAEIRPCLLGDCAFSLGLSAMKTASEAEARVSPAPERWSSIASQARKPAERAFGILKSRFYALKQGLRLQHEDDLSFFCRACIALHNLCIDSGDDGEGFLELDEEAVDELVTAEAARGKRSRDALLHYVTHEIGNEVDD